MWRANRPPGRGCEMVDFLIGLGLGLAFGAVVGWVLGVERGGPRIVYEMPKAEKKPRGGKLGDLQGITDEELARAIRERVEELEQEDT